MEERVRYQEMRSWLLNCYYNYCRSKLIGQRDWVAEESETAYAYDQFSNAFDSPLENLMLEVLSLILDGGRFPQFGIYHRTKIAEILRFSNLNDLLADVHAVEAEEFLQDMKILQLI
ncbi:MAG: hypothetical protein ACRYGK_12430 [Janthinobacterium lividum]